MRKSGILIGLAALLVTFAATATSSYAHFVIEKEKLEEPAVTVTNPGRFILLGEKEKILGEVKCTGLKVHALFGNFPKPILPIIWSTLEPTEKLANDLSITVLKWGTCAANLAGSKLAATVSENCLLEVIQLEKEFKNLMGALRTPCNIEVKAAGCKIEVPGATTESSETNGHLEGISVENTSSKKAKIEANTKGILAKGSSGLCPKSESADLLEFAGEAEGVQVS